MAKSPRLRAVGPEDVPARQLTLAEAAESGDYLELLRAQRRDIAGSLPDEKGPAKAALHRQLSLVAKEIEQIESRFRDEEAVDAISTDDSEWEAV